MPMEFCAGCRALRNMEVAESRREEVDDDGARRTVVTRIYHCETCRRFVRSEEAAEGLVQNGA